jgi:hypothetical protein
VLRRADPQPKESYRLCKQDYETEEEVRAQQRAVEPLMTMMMMEEEEEEEEEEECSLSSLSRRSRRFGSQVTLFCDLRLYASFV